MRLVNAAGTEGEAVPPAPASRAWLLTSITTVSVPASTISRQQRVECQRVRRGVRRLERAAGESVVDGADQCRWRRRRPRTSTRASQVVVVLPLVPVTASSISVAGRLAVEVRGDAGQSGPAEVTVYAGPSTPDRALRDDRHRALWLASAGEVRAIDNRSGEGDEEVPWLHLPGVPGDARHVH